MGIEGLPRPQVGQSLLSVSQVCRFRYRAAGFVDPCRSKGVEGSPLARTFRQKGVAGYTFLSECVKIPLWERRNGDVRHVGTT